jgi:NAD(P)-dependent dehydrogenase (short-subunit alcohol dehydrogenase family)
VTAPDDAAFVVVGAHTFIGGRLVDRLAARGRNVIALIRPPLDDDPATIAAPPHAADTPLRPEGTPRGPEPRGATTDVGPTESADRSWAAGTAAVAIEGDGPGAVVAAIETGAAGRRVAAVLHAEIDAERCAPAALGELTPDVWHERCARPVDSALWTARAAFALMAGGEDRTGGGGVLGFVCPSVALTGAAGQVALSTTSEAIRLLAKSAARSWGRFGITVNAFAPHVDACVPPVAADEGQRGLQVHATALDLAEVDPADDIASLLVYLAAPGAAPLTGATLGADGGSLMAP